MTPLYAWRPKQASYRKASFVNTIAATVDGGTWCSSRAFARMACSRDHRVLRINEPNGVPETTAFREGFTSARERLRTGRYAAAGLPFRNVAHAFTISRSWRSQSAMRRCVRWARRASMLMCCWRGSPPSGHVLTWVVFYGFSAHLASSRSRSEIRSSGGPPSRAFSMVALDEPARADEGDEAEVDRGRGLLPDGAGMSPWPRPITSPAARARGIPGRPLLSGIATRVRKPACQPIAVRRKNCDRPWRRTDRRRALRRRQSGGIEEPGA